LTVVCAKKNVKKMKQLADSKEWEIKVTMSPSVPSRLHKIDCLPFKNEEQQFQNHGAI